MIFTLKNADFSASNIGTLSSWRIVKSLRGVTTDSTVVNVSKDASYSAIFNVSEGYEFNNAVVTMDGNDISANLVWNTDKTIGTLTISSVTGHVYISIIADALIDDDEDVIKQYTITYKYISESGQLLRVSTTEKVDEGTFKEFSINNAPEIEDYEISQVVPTSATINGNTTVSYIYAAIEIEEPEDPDIPEDDKISVTSVSLDQTSITVKEGENVQLTATVLPKNATNKRVTWSASNSNCTVTQSGLVYGLAEGDSVITVTTRDGGFTATCNVTIEAAQQGGGSEGGEDDNLPKEEVWYVDVAKYGGSSIANLVYSGFAYCNADTIAACVGVPINALRMKVSKSGIFTYGKTNNSVYEKLGTLNIERSSEISTYILDDVITLAEGERLVFNQPTDTGQFTYYTDGGNSHPEGKFDVKITAADPNGQANTVADLLSIDIGYVPIGNASVTGITLDKSILNIGLNETYQLTATVLPGYAANKRVTWSASNSNCTVTQSGLVTAITEGECVITARTVDGGFEATCSVTVRNKRAEVWYVDAAQASKKNGTSKVNVASFAYPINTALIGVPINAIRLAVAQAGILSYGKVSAAEYTKLGTVTLADPSKEVQTYMLEDIIQLSAEEAIWFQATDDTGLFYYDSTTGNTLGNFKAEIKAPTKVIGGNSSNLSIDVGYIVTEEVPLTAINITNKISSLGVGNGHQLSVKPVPLFAELPELVWTASNENCTVTQNGLVTAVAEGECTITVSSLSGLYTDSMNLIIYDDIPTTWYVDGMAGLSGNNSTSVNTAASFTYKDEKFHEAYRGKIINALRLAVAKAGTFTYGKVGANATELYEVLGTIELEIVSKNTQTFIIPEIIINTGERLWFQGRGSDTGFFYYGAANSSVSGYTGFVTHMHPDATEASSNGILGIDIGYVNPDDAVEISVIELSKSNITLNTNETYQLNYLIAPSNATNKELVWKSSNKNVCTVNNGLVTTLSAGIATITLETEDGKVSDTCVVNVLDMTLYQNVAAISSLNAASNDTGGFMYSNANEIATYVGVPINTIRLAVATAGTLTYGKTDGTTRTTLGVITLANPSKTIQEYRLEETVTLIEGENLWFSDSTDTGRFYYQMSTSQIGKFKNGVTEAKPNGGNTNNFNLSIDIGYRE
jgi:uncharacterized protein YjdB